MNDNILLTQLHPDDLQYLMPAPDPAPSIAMPRAKQRTKKSSPSTNAVPQAGNEIAATPATTKQQQPNPDKAADSGVSLAKDALAKLSAQEHPLPKYEPAEPTKPRHRQYIEHVWPAVDTILTAEYFGQTYEAKIVPAAKRLKSGKQILLLNGPARGQIFDSLSVAMLTATEEQRRREHRNRQGTSNGWAFWAWPGKTVGEGGKPL